MARRRDASGVGARRRETERSAASGWGGFRLRAGGGGAHCRIGGHGGSVCRNRVAIGRLPQGRIVAPANNQNFGWIGRAITQCEAEAARNADTLYFLVIPVVAPDGDQQAWLAKSNGTVGDSVLLGSQDTLDGLRAGSLRLARRPFNFSILEPSTSRVYKWKPALGVHKFAIRDAKAVAAFKPGFEIPAGGDTRWADGAIPREAGTCYWTGALMRG